MRSILLSRRGSLAHWLCLLAAAIFLLASASPAIAAHFSPLDPGQEEEDEEEDPECGLALFGDPVNTFSGKLTLVRDDLVVDGIYPIRVTRFYDSHATYDSPLGYGWSHSYDMRLFEYPLNDNEVIIRSGCGRLDRFTYTGNAYVRYFPPGDGPELVSDGDGTFTLTYQSGRKALFDAQGRLEALHDEQGNRHLLSYSATKRPLTGVSPFAVDPTAEMTVARHFQLEWVRETNFFGSLTGRAVRFAYDAAGRLDSITQMHDGVPVAGREVFYFHDEPGGGTRGNLRSVTGLAGVVENYGYDDPADLHNVTSIEQGGTTAYTNTYGTVGIEADRVISQVRTRGAFNFEEVDFDYLLGPEPGVYRRTTVTRTTYDAAGQNPVLGITTHDFDSAGYLLKITDPLQHEHRFSWNSTWRRVDREEWHRKLSDGSLVLESATDYTYYGDGNRETRSVFLAGTGETVTETWTYAEPGLRWLSSYEVVSDADPGRPFRTEFTYCRTTGSPATCPPSGPIRNIASISRLKEDGTSFETTGLQYNTSGQLQTVVLPDGHRIRYSYYSLAEDETSRRGKIQKIHQLIGGWEHPAFRVEYDYDESGFRSVVQNAKRRATITTHDARGRAIRISNAKGEDLILTYTGPDGTSPGELVTKMERGWTSADGEGQVTIVNYSPEGYIDSIERMNDQGNPVTFVTLTNDSDGRRLTMTDAEGREIRYGYDERDDLISIEDPEQNATLFGYDARRNRTSILDAEQRETQQVYDEMGRLIEVVALGPAPNQTTRFGYDAVGNTVLVTDPENRSTTYDFDRLSQLTKITPQIGNSTATEYFYDERGRLDYTVNARDDILDYEYYEWGPLEKIEFSSVSDPTVYRTMSYTYDDVGNVLTAADDSVQAGDLFFATYDELERLDVLTETYIAGAPQAQPLPDPFEAVLLYTDTAGNLLTGSLAWEIVFGGGPNPSDGVQLGAVAFEARLEPSLTPGAYIGERPDYWSIPPAGVAAVLGPGLDTLPGDADVTLDFLVEPSLGLSLAYWDDAAGQFVTTPNGETMRIGGDGQTIEDDGIRGPLGPTNELLGIDIGPTYPSGHLYQDHEYYLDPGTAPDVTPGVYLVHVRANVVGVSAPSNPYWIALGTFDDCGSSCTPVQDAFNADIEQQLDAALHYVNTVLNETQPFEGILLYTDASGNLLTGSLAWEIVFGGGTNYSDGIQLDTVAFRGEFEYNPAPGAYAGERPDYWSIPESGVLPVLGPGLDTLPPDASVALDFMVDPRTNLSLAYWDHAAAQFVAPPNDETMRIGGGAGIQGPLGGTNELLDVFIDDVGPTGHLYTEVDYYLDPGTAPEATPGVYLVYLRANVEGISGPSNPYWIALGAFEDCDPSCTPEQDAFNASLDQQLNAAVHHLNSGGLGRRLDYDYDRFGNRSQLLVRDGSQVLLHTYPYDKLNRLGSGATPAEQVGLPGVGGASTQHLAFDYWATDEIMDLTRESGVRTHWDYRPQGPVSQIVVETSGGSSIETYGYPSHDKLGNVLTMSDQDGSHFFVYDELYRLIEATRPALSSLPDELYSYSPGGNREDPGDPAAYDYDLNHRITSSPGISSYGFDDDGNVDTRSDGVNYSFDSLNRLEQIDNSGVNISYTYDPFGRRIKKSVAGVETMFLWDGDRLLAEYDGSGNRIARYAYAEGWAPLQVERGGDLFDIHTDHLGTPRRMTGQDQSPVWRAELQAFGSASTTGSPDLNIRFAGQYFDSESQLHYNGQRYYDPAIGRYVGPDPVGQLGMVEQEGLRTHANLFRPQSGSLTGETSTYGLELYPYAASQPMGFSDPTGEAVPLIIYVVGSVAADVALQLALNGGRLACVDWLSAGTAGALGAFGGAWRAGRFAHSVSGVSWSKGAQNWNAVSRRYRKAQGVQGDPNVEVHHWLIERNSTLGKPVRDSVKNHPLNLHPVSAEFHTSLHAMNPLARTVVGAPPWAQAAAASIGAGAAASWLGCDCY